MSKVDELSIGEASKLLRVSVRTLQRWDASGRLVAERSDTDRRIYTRDQLAKFVRDNKSEWKPDRTVYLDETP